MSGGGGQVPCPRHLSRKQPSENLLSLLTRDRHDAIQESTETMRKHVSSGLAGAVSSAWLPAGTGSVLLLISLLHTGPRCADPGRESGCCLAFLGHHHLSAARQRWSPTWACPSANRRAGGFCGLQHWVWCRPGRRQLEGHVTQGKRKHRSTRLPPASHL